MQEANYILFCDKDRTESSRVKRGETLFQYYDRSSDMHAVKTRMLLNSWLPRLPIILKERILNIPYQNQRKIYEHDKKFISVIYEAYIYIMLLGLGIGSDQIKYEQLAANGRYPEFFVDLGVDSFYVEATVAGDVSPEEKSLSEIIDQIDSQVVSDLYNLRLTTFDPSINGEYNNIIRKGASVIYEVATWLNTLNLDLVKKENDINIDKVSQKLTLNFRGVGLILKPVVHYEEYARTIISVSPYMANSRETDIIIRKKVERKHEQLRGLEFPCVLAINTLYDFAAGEWDLTKSLLGDVCMSFSVNENIQPSSFRLPNGVFGQHEAKHNFLSGVILSPGLNIGNMHRARMDFLINPWATHQIKYNNPLMQLKRMSVDPITGEVFKHEGKDIATVINSKLYE